MNFSIFSVVLILGIVQGITIAILLFRKKSKLSTFLGLLVLNIGLDLLASLMNVGHFYDHFPSLYFLPLNYNLGYGPLIYFVTIYFVKSDSKIKKIEYVGFIPVLLQALFYWVVFWLPLSMKGELYRGLVVQVIWPVENYGTIIIMAIYLCMSCKFLIEHKNEIINSCSFGSRFYFTAKMALTLFVILYLVWIFAPILLGKLNININLLDILLVASVYCLGIMVLNYNSLIKEAEYELLLNRNAVSKGISKVALISGQKLTDLTENILKLFEELKIHKNPDLSLKILADQLDSNEKVISYVINSSMKSTFNSLVNSYRVKEAQQQIENEENNHLTLLGIAFNSGFNSKSSFNLIFKQSTGLTPKEYKSRMKQASKLTAT